MRILPYGLPLLVIAVFITSVYTQLFWVGPFLIPVITLLNPLVGTFSQADMIHEYYFFHHSRQMALFKRISGIVFILFDFWALYFFYTTPLPVVPFLLSVYSIVIININLSISLAHDLMHASSAFDRAIATGLLLINGFFYLETDHLYIHHRYVGTAGDPASARYNEGLYRYLLRSVPQRMKLIFSGTIGIDAAKKNTIFRALIIRCVLCMMILTVGFLAGPQVFWCIVAQFIFVPLIYEVITYIQHYALARKTDPSGKPVGVELHHAWNCYYKISAYLHFMVATHSIHHLRREPDPQALDTAGPAYPKPFTNMVVLAFFPGYWFRLMNEKAKHISQIQCA